PIPRTGDGSPVRGMRRPEAVATISRVGAASFPATAGFSPRVGLPARGIPHLRAWQAAALVGLGAFTLHVGLGLGGAGSDHFFNHWLYSGLLILAAGACLTRAFAVRAERAIWLLLGIGLASWTVGDVYYTFAFAGIDSPPFPSI